jgi:hypothetical protein
MTKNIINGGKLDTVNRTNITTHNSTETIHLKLKEKSTNSIPKRRLSNTNKSFPKISNPNLLNKYSSLHNSSKHKSSIKYRSLPINLKQILKEKLKNLSSMNVEEQIQILEQFLRNLSSMTDVEIQELKQILQKSSITSTQIQQNSYMTSTKIQELEQILQKKKQKINYNYFIFREQKTNFDDKIKTIFDNFDLTNNGIILHNNSKKGGNFNFNISKSKLNPDNIFSNYYDDVIKYKESINEYITTHHDEINIDDKFIECMLLPDKIVKFKQLNKEIIIDEKLKDMISSNHVKKEKEEKEEKIELNKNENDRHKLDDFKKIKDVSNPILYTSTNKQINDFTHNGYNKSIVQAYENKYIENIENLKNFIKEQEEFIKGLTYTEIIIINDYTKKSCFDLYSAYAYSITRTRDDTQRLNYQRIVDGSGLKNYTGDFMFGDSYYKQIFDYIGGESFTYYVIYSKNNNILIDKFLTWIHDIKRIKQDFFKYYFKDIEDYWKFLIEQNLERPHPDSESIFKSVFKLSDWQVILINFIKDIDVIIKKAPETKHDIYCYRGTTFDYIEEERSDSGSIYTVHDNLSRQYEVKRGIYTSIRPGSLSINFDSALKYTVDDKGNKGNLYRAVILNGTKVLYIASLSYASHEFEILHSPFASFCFKGEKQQSFNNRNNKWGILSKDDKGFDSIDIVLSGYIEPTEIDPQISIGSTIKRQYTTTAKHLSRNTFKKKEIHDRINNLLYGDIKITDETGIQNVLNQAENAIDEADKVINKTILIINIQKEIIKRNLLLNGEIEFSPSYNIKFYELLDADKVIIKSINEADDAILKADNLVDQYYDLLRSKSKTAGGYKKNKKVIKKVNV